jgi:uncharacterized Ntn-hydrolase superfamily protein
MTFSIVARSADGSHLGVAVASKFLAAGAVVPAARAGVGAVATQSFVNLRYLPDGLALLEQGVPAVEALRRLTDADPLRDERQAGIVDADGGSAAFTGSGCIDWAGHLSGQNYTVQGNCLAGSQVLEAMVEAFGAGGDDAPLSRRLLAALVGADAAGGDRRGRQSAALLVVTPGGGYAGGSDVLVDLRADDHATPIHELDRLLDLHELYFGKPDPATLLPLEGELAREVTTRVEALGFPTLDDWAGWANYEERLVPGSIDPVVLEKLRAASTGASA